MGWQKRASDLAALRGLRSPAGSAPEGSGATAHGIRVDDPADRRFARSDPRFDHIVHVFHLEWVGIRAACGSLPGHKIAVPADAALTDRDLDDVVAAVERLHATRAVLHGFSGNMARLVRTWHRRLPGLSVFAVFHGSSAQWVLDYDRAAVVELLGLARSGFVRRFHIMKAGLDTALANQHRPILYNVSPELGALAPHVPAPPVPPGAAVAFAPGWNVVHKNVVTNVVGALQASATGEVRTFVRGMDYGFFSNKPVRILPPATRDAMFETYRGSDICLNVSLLDCHPMTNVEAQAVGTPCLRGPLFLDHLDDHPYVRLTEVANAGSTAAIARAVDRCLDVPRAEMLAMLVDYRTRMDREALDRYAEFLGV